jgi:hypothetical protein
MKAIRWSDNDRYLGPFTYARDSRGYRPLALVLGSGDDDDYPHCRLRLSGFGHTLVIRLPQIIQPWRRKVVVTSWDEATVKRLGRDWYYDTHEREYGFSYSDGHLSVYLGRQTNDSSTEQRWGCFLPWTQGRHVRPRLSDREGRLFATMPDRGRFLDTYEERKALEESCPSCAFRFEDFDGEDITAITRIEERQWKFGTGWFKWLSLFRRDRIRRSLDLRFTSETGKRKGSWKGGTIGTGIDMLPGELHEAAFKRYCGQNEMRFIDSI